MELNREQAIDILERFDFFQGQRAGRELWNSKPFDVQEQDIAKFSQDVASLKNYIKELTKENEAISERYAIQVVTAIELDKQVQRLTEENESTKHKYKEFESSAKQEVAKLTAENVKLTEENERLRATGEWISVEDRLPDNYRAVLVVAKGTSISGGKLRAIGSYGGGCWSMADADGTMRLTKYMQYIVTHWMELPKVPKGD